MHPDVGERFTLESAQAAAAENRTAIWVGEFLASPGSDNAVLAAALAQHRHWWLGPIQIPLGELERLAGPEDDVLVHVAPAEWEGDVRAIDASIDEGWEPPPLLAEYQQGRLLLQDGNHRFEALERRDERDAWVLIFFDDPAARDEYVNSSAASRRGDE